MLAFGPQPDANAGRGAAGPAGPLVGGGATDFFDEQGVDSAMRIEAGNAGETAVEHDADAVNGYRCFRDIGGDDDLAAVIAFDGGILIAWRKLAVQGQN